MKKIHIKIAWVLFIGFFCTSLRYESQAQGIGYTDDKWSQLLNDSTITYLILDSTINSMPPDIGRMKRLTDIQFIKSPISKLPNEFYQLPLQSINFAGTANLHMNEVLSRLRKCRTLTTLSLSYLHISDLPSEIGELAQLRSLIIGNTALSSLPASIGKLENLEELALVNIGLDSLPETVNHLMKLRFVSIACNNLYHLPANFLLFPHLTEIELDSNPTLRFSDVLSQLMQYEITSLSMRDCNLLEVPTEVALMKNLSTCILDGNKLHQLPSSIMELPYLIRLSVNHNMLKSLPPNIGNLSQLQYLEAASNQLTRLPQSLDRLSESLVHLILLGNSFPNEEKERIRRTFSKAHPEL